LFVRDAAQAIVRAAECYDRPDPLNLGSGCEITISDLADLIAKRCGFRGVLRWDASQPDGQPRRCLDTSRAWRELGFRAETSLDEGLAETIAWYRAQAASHSRAA
jgi:GDP-L-fucose synthase